MWADRRIEVGLSLLHVSEKEHCSNSWVQRILCASVFQRRLVKRSKSNLIQQTENVQAARQIRFTNVREIVKMKPILKAYVKEAIEVEKAGLKVNYKKTSDFLFFSTQTIQNPGGKG
jgi:hypothetical protein